MHAHSADALLQTALGFRAAQALLCAVELGLFSELARGPRTARQLLRALGLSERAAPDLLDALVAMGVLDREGDDAQAVYLNTRAASRYLDRRSADYLGGVLEAAHPEGYRRWGELGPALKGAAVPLQRDTRPAVAAGHPFGYALDALAAGLDGAAWRSLACVDPAGDRLAAALGARHPQLRVARVALNAPLPAVDAIVLVGVLGEISVDAKRQWIARAHAALPDDGGLIAIEPLIDDARRQNLHALLASLDALLAPGGDGVGFSGADFDRWCRAAGFRETSVLALDAACSLARARK